MLSCKNDFQAQSFFFNSVVGTLIYLKILKYFQIPSVATATDLAVKLLKLLAFVEEN